ncbi:MAG: hypothetical protein M3290_00090 [Actinomycetota bacterium]|nr:hypothetical protein [Actinomycetota bacterium]
MRFRLTTAVLVTALIAAPLTSHASTRAPRAGCSWPMLLDEDALNAAFPDTSATYWMAHFPYAAGGELTIRGRYPDVRYFSFHVYDEAQRPVDSIADYEIRPDVGGNPFVTKTTHPGRYTVHVEFAPRPRHPASNTIYAGAMQSGTPNPGGFLIYRIYIPTDPKEPTGGVPLPTITLRSPAGDASLALGRCDPVPPKAPGHAVNKHVRESNYQKVGPQFFPVPGAHDPPRFERFFGTDQAAWDSAPDNPVTPDKPFFKGGFLSNEQVAYLFTRTSRQFGDILVVHAKAPSFPDTRRGVSVVSHRDVRYWSVCQNEGATQRVVACSPDYQTAIRNGHFTIVISDPKDRPTNADRAHGITWLPWGGAYYDGVVIYRYMLPAATFDEAIQRIRPHDDPADVMGAYMPIAGYCAKSRFQHRGWRACVSK